MTVPLFAAVTSCDYASYLGPAVIRIVPFVNSERMCATRYSRAGRRWDWRVRLRFDLVPRATGWGTGTRLLRCGLPLAERRLRDSTFLLHVKLDVLFACQIDIRHSSDMGLRGDRPFSRTLDYTSAGLRYSRQAPVYFMDHNGGTVNTNWKHVEVRHQLLDPFALHLP